MKTRSIAVLGLVIALSCLGACRSTDPLPGSTADGGSGGVAVGDQDGQAPTDTLVTEIPVIPVPFGAVMSGCSDLFRQDVVQTYSVEIADAEWNALQDEFKNQMNVPVGQDYHPYHPITFHFGEEITPDTYIRLKGQSSWRQTIKYDGDNAKAQFVIAFDNLDANASFHGISKLVFDMPRNDLTFLHERLSNAWLRQLGILAPCSNSARLVINGAYYGLYVAEENIGHRLIKEFFPGNPDGDLYKGGYTPETNKSAPNWPRLQQFWDAKTVTAMAPVVDLAASVREWAAEVMLNDADGYWGGAHNFYLYDQGAKGYVWLPSDLDATFDWLTSDQSHPIFWWVGRSTLQQPGQHYRAVMNDPTWRDRYVEAVAARLDQFDVSQIQGWVDTWSAQIADAVAQDPHKAATVDQFKTAVAKAHGEVSSRAAFVRGWLACERGQGLTEQTDHDGDGVPWCDDCNDDNRDVRPGVPEICGNNIDDNCDGMVDEGCPGTDGGADGLNGDDAQDAGEMDTVEGV